jgi:hypothetical protein
MKSPPSEIGFLKKGKPGKLFPGSKYLWNVLPVPDSDSLYLPDFCLELRDKIRGGA